MSLEGLVEDIRLLEKITKVPENAHDNAIPTQLLECQPNRTLTLEHEQSIASALSFLSSYTDDSEKVSALCIEETPGNNGLVIHIAANHGDLQKLKAGLEGIATVLMDEASECRSENNSEKLLKEIINFNRFRLLCRLRSRHASRLARSKTPIIKGLGKAVEVLEMLNTVPAETLEGLRLAGQELERQFAQLEDLDGTRALSQQSDRFLLSILHASQTLNMKYELRDILDTIPQNEGSFPNERKMSIVEGFQKLSRYITIGPYLLRYARRLTSFRNIQVHCVGPLTAANCSLKRTIRELPKSLLSQYLDHAVPTTKETIYQFEHRLEASLANMQAKIRNRPSHRGTVHAEIRLLFYYEKRGQTQLRPRVICATKNACYLCNTFLGLHGQFYTPKTHGKLYAKWTLPDLSTLPVSEGRLEELQNIYAEFHRCIDDKILSCLERVSLGQNFDNESRILKICSLTNSQVSAVNGVMDKPPHSDGENSCRESGNSPFAAPTTANELASSGTCSSSQTTQNSTQHSPMPASDTSLTDTLAVSTLPGPKILVPGHAVQCFLTVSSPPIQLYTSRIHVELSYKYAASIASVNSRKQQELGVAERGIQVCAVWLMDGEANQIMGRPGEVDLAADWSCKKLAGALFDPEGLVLRKGREVMKLTAEDCPG